PFQRDDPAAPSPCRIKTPPELDFVADRGAFSTAPPSTLHALVPAGTSALRPPPARSRAAGEPASAQIQIRRQRRRETRGAEREGEGGPPDQVEVDQQVAPEEDPHQPSQEEPLPAPPGAEEEDQEDRRQVERH